EMAYPELIEDVRMILERIRTGSELVIDETSVGRQVSDLFRAIARPIRVNISNTGTEATQTGSATYSVPLSSLLSTIDARLHCGELRLAKDITGAVDLEASLKNLRDRASGPDIHADTLASALAVALWRSAMKRPIHGSRTKPVVRI